MSAPTAKRPGTGVFSPTRAQISERTLRTDAWWKSPLITDLGFAAFVIYATVRAFQQDHFFVEKYHYLTPFYSPCISKGCGEASEFWPQILPDVWWLPYAAASLPFLLLFRLTCYYYRKAYYRSFWLSPPACAVPDGHKRYTGETRFPLLFQNMHRYAWYVAVIFIVLLTWDALLAFRFPMPDGTVRFGIGVGTLVMWANVILLAGYTFSCHSCRHVCGGYVDVFSRAKTRYRVWNFFSRLNEKHPMFAWLSLFSVGLTDLYIRLVAMGKITDLRIIF